MAKKKKKRFAGRVGRNAAKQSRGAQFGHLNLPKGVSIFKEEPKSRAHLDIMPYEVKDENHPDRDDEYEIALPGTLWYKRPYWLHRNIGSDNEPIVCPGSRKEKCPICEYRAQLLKEGADWNDDAVRALKPSMRNLYAVIPKKSKNYSQEVHIWDISQFLFQDKLNEEIQEDEEYETFPDLEEGYTLRIRFSEEQLGNNKFADTSRIDFMERDENYSEEILEEIPILDEILEIPSYNKASAQFFGGFSEEEAEEEEGGISDDELGDLDEEDEGENEPEDEPEEEEPKQKKKDRKTKRDKKEEKTKCPHGYKFGEDCEEYDECDECDLWEECMDAAEE